MTGLGDEHDSSLRRHRQSDAGDEERRADPDPDLVFGVQIQPFDEGVDAHQQGRRSPENTADPVKVARPRSPANECQHGQHDAGETEPDEDPLHHAHTISV